MAFKKEKNRIIDYIKNSNYSNKSNLAYFVEHNMNKLDENMLYEIIKIIINLDANISNLNDIIDLYYTIVDEESNMKDINLFYRILKQYLSNELSLENYEIAFRAFKDKNNSYYLIEEMLPFFGNEYLKEEYLKRICNYLIEARRYHIDEKVFLSSALTLIDKLDKQYQKDTNNLDLVDSIVNEHILEDKKIAGIYEVDEEKIRESEIKLNEISDRINNFNSTSLENDIDIDLIKKVKELEKLIGYNEYVEIANNLIENYKDDNIYNIIYQEKEFIKDEVVKLLKRKNKKLDLEDINYLATYAIGIKENNLDLLLKIYFKDPNNNDFSLYDKSITSMFDENIYISLFPDRKDIVLVYKDINRLDKLNEILKINPDFDYKYKLAYLNAILDTFDIRDIALCKDNFVKAVKELHVTQFDFYKEILRINPNFEYCEYSKDLIAPNNIYTIDEIAHFNYTKQNIISALFSETAAFSIVYQEDIKNKLKEIVDKIYKSVHNSNKKVWIGKSLLDLLFSKKFDITIDEYLKYDYEKQQEVIALFNQYEESNTLQKGKVKKRINQNRM